MGNAALDPFDVVARERAAHEAVRGLAPTVPLRSMTAPTQPVECAWSARIRAIVAAGMPIERCRRREVIATGEHVPPAEVAHAGMGRESRDGQVHLAQVLRKSMPTLIDENLTQPEGGNGAP